MNRVLGLGKEGLRHEENITINGANLILIIIVSGVEQIRKDGGNKHEQMIIVAAHGSAMLLLKL